MTRVLGLDYGERRIGAALTDETRTIATPVSTFVRRQGKRPPWAGIQEMVSRHEVSEIVVGLPLDLAGEETAWTAEVREFASNLERRTGLPVHLVDERMTSVQAEQAVRGMGLRKTQREQKERVDAAAAALILRHFLDLERGKR